LGRDNADLGVEFALPRVERTLREQCKSAVRTPERTLKKPGSACH
jgi:hypothetical protein